MRIHIVAFASVREVLGRDTLALEMEEGACSDDVWRHLASDHPDLSALRASTRVARNGRVVQETEQLRDGDELAFIPPVGGG